MKAIVSVDANWAIGREGKLLCPVSADLKRFRQITTGHPVILGRKTLATFPGGRPLPGRRNLILSRTPGFLVEGAEVFPSLDALLAAAPEDSIVIGGESVYRALLSRCETIWVTQLGRAFPADAWFPALDQDPDWRETESGPIQEENGITFRYIPYSRVK